MDIQFILMIIIFAAALCYVGRIIYRAVVPKAGSCAIGCGKCAANFDHVTEPKK